MGPWSRPHVSARATSSNAADGGWIALHMSIPPKFWEDLAEAVGQPDMLERPEFESRPARIANYEKVVDLPRADLQSKSRAHIGRSGWPRSKCRTRRSTARRKCSRANSPRITDGHRRRGPARHVPHDPLSDPLRRREEDEVVPPPELGADNEDILGRKHLRPIRMQLHSAGEVISWLTKFARTGESGREGADHDRTSCPTACITPPMSPRIWRRRGISTRISSVSRSSPPGASRRNCSARSGPIATASSASATAARWPSSSSPMTTTRPNSARKSRPRRSSTSRSTWTRRRRTSSKSASRTPTSSRRNLRARARLLPLSVYVVDPNGMIVEFTHDARMSNRSTRCAEGRA